MKGRIAIRIFVIGTLYAVLYFTYTFFSLQGTLKGIFSQWISFLFIAALTFIVGLVLHLARKSLKDPSGESEGRITSFLISGSLTIIGILVFTSIGLAGYKYLFFNEFSAGELNEEYPGFILQVLVLSVFTGIVYAVSDHSLNSFRHLQEIRLSTMQLQTQQVNLRFESLRSQISPHFLFNSLNTISSLIYRDVNMAEKFVRNLASVYQSVLKNYQQTLVPLHEEISLVEHYCYLMQVRFEDAFLVDIDLPDLDGPFWVPPLSVQMLAENAIKHNQMSLEKPLKVSISSEGEYLVIKNNFIGDPGHVKIGKDLYKKPETTKSSGIGLQNIKSRYRIISNKPVLISKNEYFTVSIPLIQRNETEMVH